MSSNLCFDSVFAGSGIFGFWGVRSRWSGPASSSKLEGKLGSRKCVPEPVFRQRPCRYLGFRPLEGSVFGHCGLNSRQTAASLRPANVTHYRGNLVPASASSNLCFDSVVAGSGFFWLLGGSLRMAWTRMQQQTVKKTWFPQVRRRTCVSTTPLQVFGLSAS